MKKFLILILAFILAFGLCGCVTNSPTPSTPPDEEQGGSENTGNGEEQGGNTENDENAFTVTLSYHGEEYLPEVPIKAQWSNGAMLYVADFVDGIASVTGLDGDYNVTLSSTPDGITYDPNAYVATNFRKNVTVELFDIIQTENDGSDLYKNIITISELGVYRVELTKPNQTVFYQYEPKKSGFYTISSWMDITANEVNPILDVYVGNAQWKPKNPTRTIDDGGVSASVTKNFVYNVQIGNSEIGNVYAYGVRVNGRADTYPIYVDFQIKYESEYAGDEGFYIEQKAQNLPTAKTPDFAGKTFRYGYLDSGRVLDGSKYKLADDGYYHKLNSDGTISETILYAKITSDCALFSTPDNYDQTNSSNPINFMHGFTSPIISLKFEGKDYTDFIHNGYGAYEKDKDGNYIVTNGRLNPVYCNSDGVCAVTEELKQFLQDYSVSQRYFNDGIGWAEESPFNLNSAEDDQWLFACGYYI